MRRFLFFFVLVPLAIVAVALSVANRAPVMLSFDPLGLEPSWAVSAPLFILLFAALAIGVVLGGFAAWSRQRKWRQAARAERAAAERLREELERLRGRIVAGPAIPPPFDRDAA